MNNLPRTIDVVVERLNYYMGKYELSQYKVAELSDLPYSTVKSIMQKRARSLNLDTIIKLAKAFNMTASEFIDGESFLYENLDLK